MEEEFDFLLSPFESTDFLDFEVDFLGWLDFGEFLVGGSCLGSGCLGGGDGSHGGSKISASEEVCIEAGVRRIGESSNGWIRGTRPLRS